MKAIKTLLFTALVAVSMAFLATPAQASPESDADKYRRDAQWANLYRGKRYPLPGQQLVYYPGYPAPAQQAPAGLPAPTPATSAPAATAPVATNDQVLASARRTEQMTNMVLNQQNCVVKVDTKNQKTGFQNNIIRYGVAAKAESSPGNDLNNPWVNMGVNVLLDSRMKNYSSCVYPTASSQK